MNDSFYKIYRNRFYSRFNGFKNISFLNVLKWRFSKLANKNLDETREIIYPEINREHDKLNTDQDFIIWLGHSTFLIQINKIKILTDPVFGNIPLFKRKTETAYSIDEIGKIDLIVISHSHYDHLDLKSIKQFEKFAPKILAPLKTKKYFNNIKNMEIIEMDWFESIKFDEVEIIFLPAKHWSRRSLFDLNKTLWGSFLIKNIYFAGDTAYSEHFKIIGNKYKIKYALMPIGAYKPEIIMKNNHVNPEESINGFIDLKAEIFIPMHYGTFKLSDEPMDEPLKLTKELSEKYLINLKTLKIGEFYFCNL